MKTRIVLILSALLFSATLLAGTRAFAQVTPYPNAQPFSAFPVEHTKQVSMLLNHYHDIPDKALFEQIPNAQQIVVSIALQNDDWLQDRALMTLAKYWVTADLYLQLASVVTREQTRFATRIRLMQVFADTFGARAIPALKGYLKHSDLQFRLSAIRAIGSTQTEEGFQLLSDLKDADLTSPEREAIEQYGRLLR